MNSIQSKILFIYLLLNAIFCGRMVAQNANLNNTTDTIATEKKALSERISDPRKAMMLSAALPGAGQFYNHKYWKIPFVAAAFGGCIYGLNWNQKTYLLYRNSYLDLHDTDPTTNRWKKLLPDYTFSDAKELEDRIKTKQSSYRRDRDLMIIVTVGVYIINILDANVDAHLSDFDISEDLSMAISPGLIYNNVTGGATTALSLKLKF